MFMTYKFKCEARVRKKREKKKKFCKAIFAAGRTTKDDQHGAFRISYDTTYNLWYQLQVNSED
jgi:hypothetical protein